MIDLILLIVLGIGFYLGYTKGLISQLVGFVILMVAYIFSGSLSAYLHNYLVENKIFSQNTSSVFSFILCIILIIIVVKLLSYIVETVFKITLLNFTNRIAGGVFGVLKFVLYSIVCVFLFEKVNSVVPILSSGKTSKIYEIYKEIGLFLANIFLNYQ